MPFMLNCSILMLRLVVFCRLYVVWLGGGGVVILCGNDGTRVV